MARPRTACIVSHVPAGRRAVVSDGAPPAGEVLCVDEVEALRLADLEGMYLEEGACSMGVSRATFGRILERARRKTARAVVTGSALSTDPAVHGADAVRCDCPSCRRAGTGCRDSAPRGGSPRAEASKRIEGSPAMRIACPAKADLGLQSPLFEHFGSAPGFVVVDTGSMEAKFLPNPHHEHGHGMCRPLAAFEGDRPDAVAAAGMGAGALEKLSASGIDVYVVSASTVGEAVEAVVSGSAPKAGPRSACAGHGHHGGGCQDRS